MTKQILNKIARDAKINVEWYDHVNAWINEAYTKLYIEFSNLEVCGGARLFLNRRTITKNVAAIERRSYLYGEAAAWEYTTNGPVWIDEIR